MHRLDFLFSLPVREGDQYKSLVFLVVHILIYLHLGFVFFGSFLFLVEDIPIIAVIGFRI